MQLKDGEKYKKIAKSKIIKNVVLEPSRGNIYSSDNEILATSISSYEIRWDATVVNNQYFNDNKKANFRDKKKFFKREDDKKSNFKGKKKFFKKNKNKKSKFNDKKKSFGFTNNPKYFGKKSDELAEKNNKRPSFKYRKKFKKRQRSKKFSLKKHKK